MMRRHFVEPIQLIGKNQLAPLSQKIDQWAVVFEIVVGLDLIDGRLPSKNLPVYFPIAPMDAFIPGFAVIIDINKIDRQKNHHQQRSQTDSKFLSPIKAH